MVGGFIPDAEDDKRDARRMGRGLHSTTPAASAGPAQPASRGASSRPSSGLSSSANRCTECGTGVPCNDLYAAFGALVCGSCRKVRRLRRREPCGSAVDVVVVVVVECNRSCPLTALRAARCWMTHWVRYHITYSVGCPPHLQVECQAAVPGDRQ